MLIFPNNWFGFPLARETSEISRRNPAKPAKRIWRWGTGERGKSQRGCPLFIYSRHCQPAWVVGRSYRAAWARGRRGGKRLTVSNSLPGGHSQPSDHRVPVDWTVGWIRQLVALVSRGSY
jgi:hypothetical protein